MERETSVKKQVEFNSDSRTRGAHFYIYAMQIYYFPQNKKSKKNPVRAMDVENDIVCGGCAEPASRGSLGIVGIFQRIFRSGLNWEVTRLGALVDA